jgi:hypothetical protein
MAKCPRCSSPAKLTGKEWESLFMLSSMFVVAAKRCLLSTIKTES